MKRELEIIAAISESLNRAPTVQAALESTLEVIARELDLDTGWVWLVDPETGHIYSAAARNLPPYLQEPVRMTGASCWCIEQFREGKLDASNVDVMGCSRLRPAVRERRDDLTRGIAHHASVPLYFQQKPLGIMNVTARESDCTGRRRSAVKRRRRERETLDAGRIDGQCCGHRRRAGGCRDLNARPFGNRRGLYWHIDGRSGAVAHGDAPRRRVVEACRSLR